MGVNVNGKHPTKIDRIDWFILLIVSFLPFWSKSGMNSELCFTRKPCPEIGPATFFHSASLGNKSEFNQYRISLKLVNIEFTLIYYFNLANAT